MWFTWRRFPPPACIVVSSHRPCTLSIEIFEVRMPNWNFAFSKTPCHLKHSCSPRTNVHLAGTMLVEHNGDLFNCPHHMSLGHAVSEDFSMHRGLAKEFRARYENVDFLKAQRMPVGTCAVLPLENRYIFYLVTKSRFYNKPTYKSVRDAFQYLKHLLDELELTQIALPGYVCCGLDKLNWRRIKQILREVFAGSCIVVHIFHIW